MDLHEETGKENEQTLTNFSPAEEATKKDEVKIDVFVSSLSCLANNKHLINRAKLVCMGEC